MLCCAMLCYAVLCCAMQAIDWRTGALVLGSCVNGVAISWAGINAQACVPRSNLICNRSSIWQVHGGDRTSHQRCVALDAGDPECRYRYVTATTFMVLGNLNKFVVIAFGIAVLHEACSHTPCEQYSPRVQAFSWHLSPYGRRALGRPLSAAWSRSAAARCASHIA